MLWLCIVLPQLPLEAVRSSDDVSATVITACEDNARWIICCNRAAEKSGIKVGVNYTTALAIHPQVLVLERKLQAEEAALQRLAAWAYQFSGAVIVGEASPERRFAQSSALWLEIGASLQLFGGFRNLLERLEGELRDLHYTYQLGVSPTLEGAALLARSGIRVVITTSQALLARIRSLPISVLMLTSEISGQLHSSGVRTIGLLLGLPRDGLARRFGPQLVRFLARLLGEAPDPRPAFRLPEEYDARFEFECEIKSTEGLLFPLRRLLREFAGFLRARDSGVQHFGLAISHRDIEATRLRIGLSAPDRSAERFFSLVREQLERIALPAPSTGLHLTADQFASPTALQSDFINGALHQTEDLAHTIDRIVARLGDEQVHGLTTVADHRPEAGWAPKAHDSRRAIPEFPDRPLWLLPEPKPLQLAAIATISSGPERIEGGWWDAGDQRRDYYIVRISNGASLWVYRDLSANSGWRLHGFWA